ncbi:MAG: CNNM domain-containing protein [Leucobacter sp.]
MNGWIVLLTTVLLIVLSAFFVVIEFALIGARRHRLELEAAESPSARAALRGMSELTIMLAAAQLGITGCTFALGAITKPALDSWLAPILASWGLAEWISGGLAFALSLLVVTFLHLVVGEMAPKSWAIAHPEVAAKVIGIPSRMFMTPFRPLLSWMNTIANSLVARTGVTPVDRAAVGGRDAETIRQLVEHSSDVGVLEPELQVRISEAIRLRDLTAGDIPSFDEKPSSAPRQSSVAAVQRAAQTSGHLRVLLEDAEGGFTGVVHVRDTLNDSLNTPAETRSRNLLRVPADLPVYELLTSMRESRVQLALVTSEDRGSDVVTMSDVLQRILLTEVS